MTQGYSLPTDDGGDPGILMKLKGVGSEEVPTKDVVLEMISKPQEQLQQYNKDAEESLHYVFGRNDTRMVDILILFIAAQLIR